MLDLALIRQLDLRQPPAAGRAAHLSAASGLVRLADTLYVVADDEYHLGIFPAASTHAGELMRLLPGDLPEAPRERKKQKPDFEALLELPAFSGCPHGALLALGSGSTKRRHRGVLLPLEATRAPGSALRIINLDALHEALEDEFEDLNIEGATILGDEFLLLQRGNKGGSVNACVRFALRDLLTDLAHGDELRRHSPRTIRHYSLGAIDGVPLGFTDLSSLPDGRLVYTAVAENTDDSYLDGACLGAIVGVMDRAGEVLRMETVAAGNKLEGIAAWSVPAGIEFMAVTDADDASVPARLLTGVLD